ncbi:hypothetical protein ABEF95_011714 [Exophiala dermatitidis]
MSNTGHKRSLFHKPAWAAAPAASSSSTNIEGASVFGRNVAYDDILQAEQAKRERKAAAPRATKPRTEHTKSVVCPSSAKRRRISVEQEQDAKAEAETEDDDHDDVLRNTFHASKKIRENTSTHRHDQDKKPITRSTPRDEKMPRNGLEKSPRTRGTRRYAAVDRDEEDEELAMVSPTKMKKTTTSTKAKTTSIPVEEEEEDSDEEDEYLRALKQKAREKARLQRLGLEPESAPSPLLTGRSSATPTTTTRPPSIEQSRAQSSRPVSASSGREFGRTTTATPVPTEQEDDPQVRILIQSDIPNTKPLVVMRKASQSLKQVREFWCKRWELDDAVAKKVFLTWRGTRLFDSTTTRGMIKKLKEDYRQQSLGLDEDDDGEGDHDHDPSKGNILLEAMTPEIYEEKMRQKEKLQSHIRASSDDDNPDDSEEASVGVASAAEAKKIQEAEGSIVIHLVNPAYEPMHLRVRPHTTVAKIMRGYAATKKLEESKTPWLIFDGERLDPEATVENVGLEDEDEVDVSIR